MEEGSGRRGVDDGRRGNKIDTYNILSVLDKEHLYNEHIPLLLTSIHLLARKISREIKLSAPIGA